MCSFGHLSAEFSLCRDRIKGNDLGFSQSQEGDVCIPQTAPSLNPASFSLMWENYFTRMEPHECIGTYEEKEINGLENTIYAGKCVMRSCY